jgi:hypothetical protein
MPILTATLEIEFADLPGCKGGNDPFGAPTEPDFDPAVEVTGLTLALPAGRPFAIQLPKGELDRIEREIVRLKAA